MKIVTRSKTPLAGKTATDVERKTRLKKADLVRMISDSDKFPFSERIAAELYRSGVTLDEYEKSFHIEGNGVCRLIHGHIVKFRIGKGHDPKKVPPLLPVMLRYVPTAKIKEAIKSKKGRPSSEEAKQAIKRIVDDKIKLGWHESDVIKAMRELFDSDSAPAKKVVFDSECDEEAVEPAKKTSKEYYVMVGREWIPCPSKAEAMRKMQASQDKLLEPVHMPEAGRHCSSCSGRLMGKVIIVPNPTESGKPEKLDYLHFGCYFLNQPPASLPKGLKVMEFLTGEFKVWDGQTWKIEKDPRNDKTINTAPVGGSGVSASEPRNSEVQAGVVSP